MPLANHIQNRLPTQRLVELTQINSRSATTVDAARLTTVAGDVEALFEVLAGIVYDDTDARHIIVGVDGLEILLQVWKGDSSSRDRWDRWQTFMRMDFSKVTGRNRVKPKTSSRLTPSEEAPVGDVRPFFDNEGGGSVDVIPNQFDARDDLRLHGNR